MTPHTRFVATVAAGVALLAGLLAFALGGDVGISDTSVYRNYGERIATGQMPYRDFDVEYPPASLVPFVVPALFSSTRGTYDALFLAEMLLALATVAALIVLTLAALHASTRRMAYAVSAFLVGTALLGPFVMTRYDLVAAAVTLAAILAILHRRTRLGPALLGAAIATKLYPAVFLPLLVSRTWRTDGRAAALRALGVTLGTAVVVYLPFAIVAPDGVARSVWRQASRPLQIESLGSAVLLALHHTFGMPLAWTSSSGSQNLTGTVAGVASGLTTLAGVAALALVWVRFTRGDAASDDRFVRYAAAAVVAFVAFGKVSSPQFLIWLLAVVVLVADRRGAIATTLLLVACGLTRLWFPRTYWDLVKEFDPTASWLVLVRDLVLVGIFAVLVVRAGTFRARAPGPG